MQETYSAPATLLREATIKRKSSKLDPVSYQTRPNPFKHSKSFAMRLTLMVLTILRVLPVARITYTALFLAVFFSAASSRLLAVQAHEHQKTVPVERPHRKAHPAAAPRAGHHHASPAHSSRPVAAPRYTTAGHERIRRHKPAVVRASASVNRHSSRPSYHYTAYYRSNRAPQNEVASTRVERSAGNAGVDSPTEETDAPTAQTAAKRIAARELPTPGNQLSASLAPGVSTTYTPIPNSKIVAVAPLRGSLESLMRQNQKVDADQLERIENDDDLHDRIARGMLVQVPASSGLVVNPNLPEDRRYCRPWTATFLRDFSQAHEAQFHHSFEVSSAVRTVEYQKKLMRTNHNAAAAEGDVVSPHLTGATIDIAKQGMSRRELYWMRDRLNTLQSQGKIDVEEEFKQSCFHITVYRSYTGEGPPHKPTHQLVNPPAEGEDDQASPTEAASHS